MHEAKKWQKFKEVKTRQPAAKSDLELDLDHVEALEQTHQNYIDVLAPFDTQPNDFSTSAIQKNLGPNLNAEKLLRECGGDLAKIVLRVMQKCQVLNLSAIERVVREVLLMAKQDVADLQLEIIHHLLGSKAGEGIALLTQNEGLFVLKSRHAVVDQSIPHPKTLQVCTDPFIEKMQHKQNTLKKQGQETYLSQSQLEARDHLLNHLLFGEPLAKKVDLTNVQWQKVYAHGRLAVPCDSEVL